jgi:hypothetical protein
VSEGSIEQADNVVWEEEHKRDEKTEYARKEFEEEDEHKDIDATGFAEAPCQVGRGGTVVGLLGFGVGAEGAADER